MDDRIKRYSRIKYTLAVVEMVYLLFVLALLQFSGFAMWLGSALVGLVANRILLILFYCLILFMLYFMINLPLEFYRSYKLEHRFGLSREKFSHWFADQLKELFVGFVIFVILIEGFFYFLKYHPDNWWWISGIFWIFFSVILTRLFPVLIIPLFFKYQRIENDDLRQRILNLAKRMAVEILDVYQIDFSKKTTKANAALLGLGKSKRVVLTDTLQGKFSPEEIEVILSHEFAHFRLRHLIKMLMLNSAVTLFSFYLLFRFAGIIFSRFNLDLADVASLGIWIFCFVTLQVCLLPLLNWISRNMERSADRLAIKYTGLKNAFISMMEKLSQQNLVEQNPAAWIKVFFFDHPPVNERIAMVERINYADKELPNQDSAG
ncbi:MAG: M48 family metallopeptidase [Candidatus Omnitrophota bacterium]|jgi:STE24 endopeptidase